MKRIALALVLLAGLSPAAWAQQSQEFGHYEVHYNALRTDMIPPDVAQGYGIQRSPNRAMLNVTVLHDPDGAGEGTAVAARVEANAKNLTGQRRDIELREIREGDDAIYYIGVLPVHNLETYDFHLRVTPEGLDETLELRFRQQFYTE